NPFLIAFFFSPLLLTLPVERAAAQARLAKASAHAPPLAVVKANDNRKRAGELKNGVLTVRLVVGMARWYPESPTGPFVDVPALAEEGKQPQIPAPLIRVRTGTTIVATIRNTLTDSTVYVRGLVERPAASLDSISIAPGQSRTVRFVAGAPGTYFYMATPGLLPIRARPGDGIPESEQLGGAFVVDPEGGAPPDRIFVLNIWGHPKDSNTYSNAVAINGRTWPFTERVLADVGDTLRWHVVNATTRNHPMHLHGFYFRVDARGTGRADTLYASAKRRLAVTEDLSPGHTMYMVWSPDRAGNWLFHCHITFHVFPGTAQLTGEIASEHALHSVDAAAHMSGLVLGITVNQPGGLRPARRANVRKLHLFVNEGRRRGHAPRALGYVLQRDDRVPALDSVEIPGSTIVVTRDEPTDVTIVNRLREATSIHWHGIELESYSDGVAGWSGNPSLLAPTISPNDSFTARLTLPRAGTFMYHTHLNDIEQLTSGLFGPIIVLEPGQKFDPSTDHVFTAGWDGRRNPALITINGDSATGPLIEMAVGVPHRFRFINIGPAVRLFFAIRRGADAVTWRGLAKDGADLPPALAVTGPSIRRLGVGEMYDAEFMAREPGEYVVTVGPPDSQLRYKRKIIVR
ncbi:MAG: multicopper oxidase domain-containing protein, partial [Gemmatimonadota bacterium]|nr:multicopper oxidase domain-containing protein [Gemmatimonadota bacterium]